MAVGYSCMHLVGIDDTECDGSIHKMCTRVHFQLMCIYIHIIYVRTVCMHNKRFIHRAYI